MRCFREVTDDFCSWVEGKPVERDIREWLPQILAELVFVVFTLPDDCSADVTAPEGYTGRVYQEVRRGLSGLPLRNYLEVFDAIDLDKKETVVGDLYDDVADIYRDLAEGLFIYEHVSATEGERYWRQSFRYHWGEHATSALRALYCIDRERL